jgi:hypothetical protein
MVVGRITIGTCNGNVDIAVEILGNVSPWLRVRERPRFRPSERR